MKENLKAEGAKANGFQFVAPVAGDARGMCPGLNALANHGYLPHNGVATIAQFIDATFKGFGMATDLATFLAVYGSVVDGTLTGWSIEGVPHTGIAGSHGNYDGDSSPNYADLNQYGSNVKLVMSQFKTVSWRPLSIPRGFLADGNHSSMICSRMLRLRTTSESSCGCTSQCLRILADKIFSLEVLRNFRGHRFQESIDKNPVRLLSCLSGLACYANICLRTSFVCFFPYQNRID